MYLSIDIDRNSILITVLENKHHYVSLLRLIIYDQMKIVIKKKKTIKKPIRLNCMFIVVTSLLKNICTI